ncbi:MAG: hypothetical protein ACR2LK_16600 [Solirubrobacteraceae bacterium]
MTIIAVGMLALLAAPLAFADTRDEIREGIRNPSSGDASRETQIIAKTGKDNYGTRQSNKGDGGGAIYGCRSSLDTSAPGDPKKSTPCIRANNLSSGKAFDFQAKGRIAGIIQIGGSLATPKPDSSPFVTNATGLAVGLNADRVDNLNANEIITQAGTQAVAALKAALQQGADAGILNGICPENTVLAGGGCLETGPRAAKNFGDAATECSGAGRRLVPPDVLTGARGMDEIDLGSGEMTNDTTNTSGLLGLSAGQGYVTVDQAGAFSVAGLTGETAFRCITGGS